MKKHLLGFTAAIFVVNGMTGSTIFAQAQPADRQPGANTTMDRAAGAGAGAIVDNGVREQSAIHEALGKAVAAVFSDKLSNLAAVINDADKQRIGDKLDGQDAQIADQIVQLKKAWQAKYDKEFDLSGDALNFGAAGLKIRPGSLPNQDEARIVSDRVDVNAPRGADSPPGIGSAIDHAGAPARPQPEADTSSSDRDFGNSVIAIIPARKNLQEVSVPLTRDALGSEWKLDLPNAVDGNQLKVNLQHQLSALLGDKQNWPADVKDGYRAVAHHTLAALENVRSNAAVLPASATK